MGIPRVNTFVHRVLDPRVPLKNIRNARIIKPLTLLPALCLLAIVACEAGEALSLNLRIANDLSEKAEKKRVKHYLPPEISRQDILDTGGLQIGYDEKTSLLYLYGEETLDPGQSKNYKVVVADIWKISRDEIAFLKKQIANRLEFLKGTNDLSVANALAEKLNQQLDEVDRWAAENASAADISERIEKNRIYSEEVRNIRDKVLVMSDFVKEARLFDEKPDEQKNTTIQMHINTKNPTGEEQKDKEVRYYLPRGVRAEHVLEAEGLVVKYDPARALYFLEGRFDLGPREDKKTVVTLRNVWQFADIKLDRIRKDAAQLNDRLKKTQYADTSQSLLEEIEKLVQEIQKSQAEAQTPLDAIAGYSTNLKRYNAAQDGVARLRQLVEEVEHQVPQTVPYRMKPATPDVATTWKLIFITMGFLTILGGVFYLLWWIQAKKRMDRKIDVLNT